MHPFIISVIISHAQNQCNKLVNTVIFPSRCKSELNVLSFNAFALSSIIKQDTEFAL